MRGRVAVVGVPLGKRTLVDVGAGFRLRGSFVRSRWRRCAHRGLKTLPHCSRPRPKEEAALLTKSGFRLDCVCVVSLEVDQRTELHVLEVLELNGSGARAIRDGAIDDAFDVHLVPLISQFAGVCISLRPKSLSVRLRHVRRTG